VKSRFGCDDPIILGVRADPHPNDHVATLLPECAVMTPGSNTESIRAALQPTEMKGGVVRVTSPQVIVLDSQILNLRW
jgi:hypothetical protein